MEDAPNDSCYESRLETPRCFEQVDLDDDDQDTVSRDNPMLSGYSSQESPVPSNCSRGSSVESLPEEDTATPRAKVQHYERRRQSSGRPRPESCPGPRIPVVSRPYLARPVRVGGCVFPLPPGLTHSLGEAEGWTGGPGQAGRRKRVAEWLGEGGQGEAGVGVIRNGRDGPAGGGRKTVILQGRF
jgi:hypothetical protein